MPAGRPRPRSPTSWAHLHAGTQPSQGTHRALSWLNPPSRPHQLGGTVPLSWLWEASSVAIGRVLHGSPSGSGPLNALRDRLQEGGVGRSRRGEGGACVACDGQVQAVGRHPAPAGAPQSSKHR